MFGRNSSPERGLPANEREFSRRDLLKGAAGAAALTTQHVITKQKDISQKAGRGVLRAVHGWLMGRRVPMSEEDTQEIVVTPHSVVVGLGNSNEQGTETRDGKPLVQRIAEKSTTDRKLPLSHVSGAVHASRAEHIPKQYEGVAKQIPDTADQHLDVWATENQVTKFPEAVDNLKSLSQNPKQPWRWFMYIFHRGKIIDSLEEDLNEGINKVIERGKGRIKSVRIRGASPVQRSKKLEQIDPRDPRKKFDVPVSGDSDEALVTQSVIAELGYQATRVARDVGRAQRRKRKGKVQITVDDPSGEIHTDNFKTDDHFDDDAANRIANKTVHELRRGREN